MPFSLQEGDAMARDIISFVVILIIFYVAIIAIRNKGKKEGEEKKSVFPGVIIFPLIVCVCVFLLSFCLAASR